MARGTPSPRLLAVVGTGGAAGTALRFAAGHLAGSPGAVTLLVNLVGAAVLGFLLGWSPWTRGGEARPSAARPSAAQAFFGTGVLGGFTTYSALALEVVQQPTWQGIGYGALTVVAGVAAAVAGIVLGRAWAR